MAKTETTNPKASETKLVKDLDWKLADIREAKQSGLLSDVEYASKRKAIWAEVAPKFSKMDSKDAQIMGELSKKYAQLWDKIENPQFTEDNRELIELLINIGVLRTNSTLASIQTHIFALKVYTDDMGHHFWFRKPLPFDDVLQTRALSKKERGRIVSFYNLLETGHKDFPITKPEMKAIVAWTYDEAKSEERHKHLKDIGLIKSDGMPNTKKYRDACLSLMTKHSRPSWRRKLSSFMQRLFKR